jgi:hypothetical protein
MQLKTIIELVGIIVGVGLFLLRYANKISSSLQFISLPQEVRGALVALSHIPTLLAWIALPVGLGCLGFLIYDTKLAFFAGAGSRVRKIPLEPVHVIILGLVIAALGVVWQMRAPAPTRTVATDTVGKTSLAWVFSGMAGKSDDNGFRVSDIQFWSAKNETGKAVRLVDAYIQSGIDGGKRRPLLLNTLEHGLIPVNQASPIPPNTANITLMAELPELSEADFMRDWGSINFVIQDSDHAFQGKVDESSFKTIFDGYRPKAPAPKVTRSEPLKPMLTQYDVSHREKIIDNVLAFLEEKFVPVAAKGELLKQKIFAKIADRTAVAELDEQTDAITKARNEYYPLIGRYMNFNDIYDAALANTWEPDSLAKNASLLRAELQEMEQRGQTDQAATMLRNNILMANWQVDVDRFYHWIRERRERLFDLRRKYEQAEVYPK